MFICILCYCVHGYVFVIVFTGMVCSQVHCCNCFHRYAVVIIFIGTILCVHGYTVVVVFIGMLL